MSGQRQPRAKKTTKGRYDEPETPWSQAEVSVLTQAVSQAPSVHNTQPWSLSVPRPQERAAVLRERLDLELGEHDPEGRDRRISCGAALTNLVLAVRSLGWTADLRIESDGGVVATVIGSRRAELTEPESQRYRAIGQRRSHRSAFTERSLPGAARDTIGRAATSPSVSCRWISGDLEALSVARLLDYAARVHHGDVHYQRELALWTAPLATSTQVPGQGLTSGDLGSEGLGGAGLVASRTPLPDEFLLASRIEHESVCVLSTRTDEPHDHVQAGEAVEAGWLEATSHGLAASVMTQPLHLAEVRTGLAARLNLAAVPQVLMRFGHPAVIPPGPPC